MQKYIPLILAVVSTNALSQILLKKGMMTIGHFEFSSSSLATVFPRVAFNLYIISGLAMLVFSMGLHLMVLSRVELSFAYPFLSISYILVLIAGYLMFGEDINYYRMAGVALICVGTVFIAHS